MKPSFLCLLLVVWQTAAMAAIAPTNGQPAVLRFMADYPTNEWVWTRSFCVYAATGVASTNWIKVGNIPVANATFVPALANGTVSFTLPWAATNAAYFFKVTASNEWGESFFSNAATNPPVLGGGRDLRLLWP